MERTVNTERRERPDDEMAPKQKMDVWEVLVRAITQERGASPAGAAPDAKEATAKRMRDLLGSDTPPERSGH